MNGEKAGARKMTANNILRQICPRVNRFLPARTSKCNCGEFTLPVLPTVAIFPHATLFALF